MNDVYFFSWLSRADFLESTKIGGESVAVRILGGSLSLLLIYSNSRR